MCLCRKNANLMWCSLKQKRWSKSHSVVSQDHIVLGKASGLYLKLHEEVLEVNLWPPTRGGRASDSTHTYTHKPTLEDNQQIVDLQVSTPLARSPPILSISHTRSYINTYRIRSIYFSQQLASFFPKMWRLSKRSLKLVFVWFRGANVHVVDLRQMRKCCIFEEFNALGKARCWWKFFWKWEVINPHDNSFTIVVKTCGEVEKDVEKAVWLLCSGFKSKKRSIIAVNYA